MMVEKKEKQMATAKDLLLGIAGAQIDQCIKNALDILGIGESEEIRKFVRELGTAKIELGLCEAYAHVISKRQRELIAEIVKNAGRKHKVLAPGHGFNSERSQRAENGGRP
jgi:hypothetical protein